MIKECLSTEELRELTTEWKPRICNTRYGYYIVQGTEDDSYYLHSLGFWHFSTEWREKFTGYFETEIDAQNALTEANKCI
jgi:hypothetical protein